MAYTAEQKKELGQRNRELAIDSLGGKCVNCGTSDNLTFDHVIEQRNGDKKLLISQLIFSNKETLLRELQKCQLLCRPCHGLKTALDRGYSIPDHGTCSRYSNYRCRCIGCVAAHTAYQREYQRIYRANRRGATL